VKLKSLLIAIALLAVLAAGAFYFNRPTPAAPVPEADTTRRVVLDPSVATRAEKIVLTTDDGKSLTLVRSDDGTWKVPAYYDFPADFSKISSFIDRLSAAHLDRFITNNPARIAHLEFAGSQVQLFGSTGPAIWSMDLGKNNDTGTGRYVRFGGSPDAFLTDLHLWLDAGAKGWAVTQLTDVPANTVAQLDLPFANGSVRKIVRASPTAPWHYADPAEKHDLDPGAIDSIVAVLGSLHYGETTALNDPAYLAAKSLLKTYTLTTFAGATVSIALGGPATPKDAAPSASPLPWFIQVTASDPKTTAGAWRQQRAFQAEDTLRNQLPLRQEQVERVLQAR
jgi:hypothetical protein